MDGSVAYEGDPSTNHSSETEMFHENGLIGVRVVTTERSAVGFTSRSHHRQRAAGGTAAGPAALRDVGARPSFCRLR